jgi:hypothetical protein
MHSICTLTLYSYEQRHIRRAAEALVHRSGDSSHAPTAVPGRAHHRYVCYMLFMVYAIGMVYAVWYMLYVCAVCVCCMLYAFY